MARYFAPLALGVIFALVASAVPPWIVAGALAALIAVQGLRQEVEVKRLNRRIDTLQTEIEQSEERKVLRDMGIEITPRSRLD